MKKKIFSLNYVSINSCTDSRGQRKKGWKKPHMLANLSVKQLSKADFTFLQQIKIIQNEPAVLTCRAEGSGRNSASSPKMKSGGSSGYWALKMISPGRKETIRPLLFPC